MASRMQLHGFVVEKSIFAKPDTLEYRFQVQSNGKVVPAATPASCPTLSRAASEVVLKGRLGPNGFDVVAERRDGQVPVEVRGQQDPGTPGNLSTSAEHVAVALSTWPRLENNHAGTRYLHPSRRVRYLRLRDRGLRRRRAPAVDAAGRERDRRVLLRRRADDGRLGASWCTRSSPATTPSVTSSATRTRRCRSSTRSPRTGADSTARSCSGCPCWRSSARSPSTSTASATAS